ncbi:MAG: ATP-binding protein [Acidobacteriota bacterium]
MYYRDGVLVPTEPAVDLVRLLSEGTYTSFPQALKEFISNAFDSDATRLDIRIDDDANAITIRDNGDGSARSFLLSTAASFVNLIAVGSSFFSSLLD